MQIWDGSTVFALQAGPKLWAGNGFGTGELGDIMWTMLVVHQLGRLAAGWGWLAVGLIATPFGKAGCEHPTRIPIHPPGSDVGRHAE